MSSRGPHSLIGRPANQATQKSLPFEWGSHRLPRSVPASKASLFQKASSEDPRARFPPPDSLCGMRLEKARERQ